jgi:hypothetical protein
MSIDLTKHSLLLLRGISEALMLLYELESNIDMSEFLGLYINNFSSRFRRRRDSLYFYALATHCKIKKS